jgi:hypothetical protein
MDLCRPCRPAAVYLVIANLAFVSVCLVGATADLHTHRPANGIGQVSMSFIVGNFTYPDTLFRAVLMLPIAALPYVVWRFQNRRIATG